MFELEPPIRAALFDLDDTLISRTGAFHRYISWFYDKHAGLQETPREEALALLSMLDGGGENDKAVYFTKIKERWPGVTEPADQLIEEFWRELARAVEPDRRALELVSSLTESDIPWGIVTNGPSAQLDKMRAAGLYDITPFTVTSHDLGHGKPDRRIFDEALARLGHEPGETLFAGDNPATDIRGAQGVGMRSAWIHLGRRWTWGDPAPDYRVGHVSELMSVLVSKPDS